MINDKSIKGVLDALADEMNKEENNMLTRILEDVPDFEATSLDEMNTKYTHTFNKLRRAIARNVIANDHDVVFIFMNYQFLKNHIERLIRDHEGHACCADKSRTILKSLCEYYITGDEIDFDYSQEYTFHLPNNVLRTHDEIIEFYEALKLTQGGYPKGVQRLHQFYQKLK